MYTLVAKGMLLSTNKGRWTSYSINYDYGQGVKDQEQKSQGVEKSRSKSQGVKVKEQKSQEVEVGVCCKGSKT